MSSIFVAKYIKLVYQVGMRRDPGSRPAVSPGGPLWYAGVSQEPVGQTQRYVFTGRTRRSPGEELGVSPNIVKRRSVALFKSCHQKGERV